MAVKHHAAWLGGLYCLSGWALGCGHTTPSMPAAAPMDDAPAWVDRVPEAKGKICALGSAEPTFFREDGKIYAAENARNQLAMTLSVKIQAVMVDVQGSGGGDNYSDSAYVQQAESFATDAVVAGAQVVSYWYDETGVHGRAHATYALACLSTDQSVAELTKKLQQTFPEAQDKNLAVRDRAKAAFDALDGAEEKHAKAKDSKP